MKNIEKSTKLYLLFLLLIIFSLFLSACENTAAPETTYTAGEIAKAVLDSAEFPKMKELAEEEDLAKYIDLDFEYVEDVSFYWQAISVELAEVLIIIPKKGQEQNALDFANLRREKIINDTEFYPSQEAAADASVSGVAGGVVYFICGKEAVKAENFLIEFLK